MSTAPAQKLYLRSGAADDVDAIVSIMERAFDPQFGEAWTRNQCLGVLPLSGVVLTIACSANHDHYGFTLVRTVMDEAELLLIAVSPDMQRQGIGQALIDDFIHSSGLAKTSRLHLEVRDGNPAINTYRRFGFEMVGRRKNYYTGPYGKRYDALTLSLTL